MLIDRAKVATAEAIVVVDDEPFSQECVVEALRGAFPEATIIGIPSVEDLYRPDGMSVALVLMKPGRFFDWDVVASAVKPLARCFPNAPIVLISVYEDEVDVPKAIAADVQGVVPVTSSLRVGVAALRLVMAGGTYYPRPVLDDQPLPSNGKLGNGQAVMRSSPGMPISTVSTVVSENYSPREANGLAAPSALHNSNGLAVVFTGRETEVLALLQKGHSNKWIADHLKLSENTIKVHVQHIMRKLHATNRTEAVILSHFGPRTH